jgi:MFS family permease
MGLPKNIRQMFGLTQDHLVLWGVSLGHAFTHWFPSTFYLLLPLIKDELGLNYTEMGLLITVRYIAGTVANFPSGMIADLMGRHHLILAIALAWVGIPYLLVGLSSSYTLLLLCMTLIGIGNNLWHPAALTLLTETYPQRKGWAMGWNASAANIGDALGPFLSGIFLAWVTWRQILVGSCVPGLGVSLLILWLLGGLRKSSIGEGENRARGIPPKGKKKLSVGEYFRGLSNLLANPSIFFLSLVNGVRSLTQNGLSTFLPSYFMHSLLLSPWLSGVYMTIIQIAGIIASPISGRLSDQYGRKRIVTAALLSTSVAIFLLAFLNIPWLFVVFLAIMGFFLYSLRPVLIAWAMEVAPKELGGSVVGIQFTFQSALSSIAPVLGGWIADRWGLMVTFYFLGAVLLLSNLLVVFVKDPLRAEVKIS